MSARQEVLKPFERKRRLMEDRISHGIEEYRKGYGVLTLKEASGKPVAGAAVSLRQLDHEFKVGANLFMLREFDSEEQNCAYEEQFSSIFNLATLPFYWNTLEPEQGKPRFAKDSPKVYRRPAPDLCLEYCESKGIMPKAHCLNYCSFMPDWARGDIWKEKALLAKRFRELAERYSQRIRDWEVTNETYWGMGSTNAHAIYDADDMVEWSFAMADRYFPANRLLINEAHSRIWCDGWYYGNRSPYYMQIERALRTGHRIDCIGMQYHMFYRRENELASTAQFYDPQRLYDVMDTYAKLGRNIQITELTIPAYSYETEDEELQAEIMRNLYAIWFSHPAMDAIIYWNLVDGFAFGARQGDMQAGENYYHGGLIRYDFTPKPAFKVIQELFQKEWHTEVNAESNADGDVAFKGFYGTYEAEIRVGDKTFIRTIELSKSRKNTCEIIL